MPRLSRSLTDGEAMVLDLLQKHYGPWNTVEEVFLFDGDQAVIFVKDALGNSLICVNLTTCASVCKEGLLSFEELKSGWLRIPEGRQTASP